MKHPPVEKMFKTAESAQDHETVAALARGPVDNSVQSAFLEGALKLGLRLAPEVERSLETWTSELLKWNTKVNLTAITDPREVAEKHLLDSLAVLPEVAGAAGLLDLGAGAGLPGIPLAIALPSLSVTMVDSVNKKVAFLKQVIARLQLGARVRAVHVRAAGNPVAEGLAPAEVVIARALMEVGKWVPFALPYLALNGRLVAMLGQAPAEAALRELAERHGLRLVSLRVFNLPLSGDPRSVASFERSH